jgi:hypothetical protein
VHGGDLKGERRVTRLKLVAGADEARARGSHEKREKAEDGQGSFYPLNPRGGA